AEVFAWEPRPPRGRAAANNLSWPAPDRRGKFHLRARPVVPIACEGGPRPEAGYSIDGRPQLPAIVLTPGEAAPLVGAPAGPGPRPAATPPPARSKPPAALPPHPTARKEHNQGTRAFASPSATTAGRSGACSTSVASSATSSSPPRHPALL